MPTDNRNYNVPAEGQTDWHVPVNENWQMIDSDVQAALDAAYEALNAASSTTTSEPEPEPEPEPTSTGGGTGYAWNQTHTDTSWLAEADANGSLTVETVTNLDADGSGSLAAAVEAAEGNDATIVVFEVGGVIDRGGETYLRTQADNLFIAGQTAPSPGVTMVNGGIRIHGDNTIVQHMTFLPGDDIDEPHQSRAITINQGASDVLVDHCTAGWAPDTNINIRDDTRRCSVINSINSEPLNDSSHPEAPHGYGFLIRAGSEDVTYMGNLQTHSWRRNLKPNENCFVAFASNYIYNWGDRVSHGSSPSTEVDWLANVVEAGPDTDDSDGVFNGHDCQVYWGDNNTLIPSDTELGDGDVDYYNSPQHVPSGLSASDLAAPGELQDFLAPMVGPRPADRAAHERRVVGDFVNRDGGIIDHHDDVGGYPSYSTNTRSLSPPSDGILDWLQSYTDEVELGA